MLSRTTGAEAPLADGRHVRASATPAARSNFRPDPLLVTRHNLPRG